MNVYPWQRKQWSQLMQSIESLRLHHGLLLYGMQGMGLNHFSRCLALTLLTGETNKQGEISEQGRDAKLFLAGNHPDLYFLEPEEGSRIIKVDQMREMLDFLHLKSQYGKYKIAIIDPADTMNPNSANALLKTLEEPPEYSLIILNTSFLSRLPITIRSRCQQIAFSENNNPENLGWLKQHCSEIEDPELLLKIASNPLAAINIIENDELGLRLELLNDLREIRSTNRSPLEIASKWKTYDSLLLGKWLQKIFADLIRGCVSNSNEYVQNIDLSENLNLVRKGLDLPLLINCMDTVNTLHRRLNGSISYNKEALLEEFLIFWHGIKINS